MDPTYIWLKTLHILGAIIFVGNIIVTAWWKLMADRTHNPVVMHFAQRQVLWTDLIFTAGGGLLLAATGFATVARGGWSMAHSWVATGVLLFALSGLIWLAVLIPLQFAQARLTRGLPPGSPIPPRYWKLARLWSVFGTVATLLPLWAVWWMVAKPA
jgi:uncharacterized membrane protein